MLIVWRLWDLQVRSDQKTQTEREGGGKNCRIICIKCFGEINSCSTSVRCSMHGSEVGVLLSLFSSWLICENVECVQMVQMAHTHTPCSSNTANPQKPLIHLESLFYYVWMSTLLKVLFRSHSVTVTFTPPCPTLPSTALYVKRTFSPHVRWDRLHSQTRQILRSLRNSFFC